MSGKKPNRLKADIRDIANDLNNDREYGKHTYSRHKKIGSAFSDWVSPITKSCHGNSGVMVLLQDWESKEWIDNADSLDDVLNQGYDSSKKTNSNLDSWLRAIGLRDGMRSAYITNVYPIMKSGDHPLKKRDVRTLFDRYTLREVGAVKPKLIICAGSIAAAVMLARVERRRGAANYVSADGKVHARVVCVPHPSGRGASKADVEKAWKKVGAVWNDIMPVR